jgi:hypothetical protein
LLVWDKVDAPPLKKVDSPIIAPITKCGGKTVKIFTGRKTAFLVEKRRWVYNNVVVEKVYL